MKVGLIGAGCVGGTRAGSLCAHRGVESLIITDYGGGPIEKPAVRCNAEDTESWNGACRTRNRLSPRLKEQREEHVEKFVWIVDGTSGAGGINALHVELKPQVMCSKGLEVSE